jgi:alkanesulfonate monooxygenase SsuD/methylene tetrahydromethanopterin reductase-like flavin-dependent oxidoreductase (luciferase family)
VRGYQSRWFQSLTAVPGIQAVGPWNERSQEDQRNRELFEECVDIILTAWREDTFAYRGKYWSFPAESQLPHSHPVHCAYGRGVDPDGTVREVGIAPRPLQPSIPLYGGFTNSLRTVLYWARVGGKPIIMSDNLDFCELCWTSCRDEAERHGRSVAAGEEAAWGGYLVLADSTDEAEAWAQDCRWYWNTWCVPYGRSLPPMLVGDADTVSRKLEEVSRRVRTNEVFLLFGQGILARDRCLKTLELFAEKVMPRFRD